MYNVCTEEYTNLKCTASCIEKSGNSKSKLTHLITSQIKEENKKKNKTEIIKLLKKKRERERALTVLQKNCSCVLCL